MSDSLKKVAVGVGMVAVVAFAVFAIWFIFFKTPQNTAPTTNTPGGSFTNQNSQSFTTYTQGVGDTQTTAVPVDQLQNSQQKIFKIANGPVANAVFIQTKNPTTTLARYTMQDSGHVFDVPLDVSGAIPRVVSNTTIPGLARVLWLEGGAAAILQYAESGVVKSAYITLGGAANSATSTARIRFLPDGIISIAASPDGKSIAYLLAAGSGSAGYVANSNGSGATKLFSIPLLQLAISWPSKTSFLVQTKAAAGVPGIAFSVSAKSGAITPLVYAQSLSATANSTFSKIVYQTAPPNDVRTTYVHDVSSGKDAELPFNPFPEKCVWSATIVTLMYCAAPLTSSPANYLDLWHQGTASAADSIFAFDIAAGATQLLAQPGSAQGGQQTDVAALSLSPDGKYILFIAKGDRTLWGIRIAP